MPDRTADTPPFGREGRGHMSTGRRNEWLLVLLVGAAFILGICALVQLNVEIKTFISC